VIGADNPAATDRLITEIVDAIDALVPFPVSATDARTSPRALCASFWYVNIDYLCAG
jgi:hypothetical protein